LDYVAARFNRRGILAPCLHYRRGPVVAGAPDAAGIIGGIVGAQDLFTAKVLGMLRSIINNEYVRMFAQGMSGGESWYWPLTLGAMAYLYLYFTHVF